jgi:putative transcriptional regulator
MTRAVGALTGVFAVFLLLGGASTARAQDLSKPMVLVATPNLQGPYMQTALLVVPMGDKHIGFILNRATEATLAKAFPDHAPSAKVVDPIFFGGPEASEAIFALLRRDPGQPSIRLFGDLFMTGSGSSIDRIIEQTPNEARYFAGFVGWMPEELAAEVEKGFWYIAEPDAALVFAKNTETMWEDLLRRLGKQPGPRNPGDRDAALGTGVGARHGACSSSWVASNFNPTHGGRHGTAAAPN